MKHPVTRELYAYWSRLRGSRAAPERNDIDPAAIRAVLCDTFILGVDHDSAEPAYSFRLSGTRLNALFLDEIKHRPIRELWNSDDRAELLDVLSTVVDNCVPVVIGLRAAPEGHRLIDLEMILLPLRHRGRTHARVLGSIAPIEVPSWLGLLKIESFSITSMRLIDPMVEHPATSVPTMPGAAAQTPRRYGLFMLHQGGR